MKSYSPPCQVHWSCSFSKLSPFRLQGGRVLLMFHGPLTRYVTLRIEHAPVMPGTFSPLPTSKETTISDPSMHHGTCVMHVPWYMSGLLISGGGETFPVHAQPAIFSYLERGPFCSSRRASVPYAVSVLWFVASQTTGNPNVSSTVC